MKMDYNSIKPVIANDLHDDLDLHALFSWKPKNCLI